tara:strand:+ start:3447 stop:4406 length:960 start_codon:yes stop_codon:yes gene_type:complete
MFNFIISKIKRYFLWFISKLDIKLFITIVSFFFIAFSIYRNFEGLSNLKITIKEIIWFSVGILFSFLSIIINAYAWKLLINSIGLGGIKLKIIRIFINTNIYKYLPGGVWHFVSRYKTLKLTLSNEKSVESILLEPLLMLVAGLIYIPFGSYNIFIIIICWSSPLVFVPGFRKFIIKTLKRMKASIFTSIDKDQSEKLVNNNKITYSKTYYPFMPLFIEVLFILFRFFGFLSCMSAFSIGSVISQRQLISSFSLAWITGLVVPAAPGGLGVFESIILFSLGSQLPEAPLLASLLCYRLVSTSSDILASLIYPIKRLLRV